MKSHQLSYLSRLAHDCVGVIVKQETKQAETKILKVFQSATDILWIVVSCKKNRFDNVCFVFLIY
jgi:hypothetical protein